MAAINTHIARPLPVPPRPAMPARGTDPAAEERDTDRARGPALRKSGLMQLLDMQDDLSGLVSSMRRTRSADAGTDDIRGQAWLDHVLDEQAPQKLDQIRQQLRASGTPDLPALRAMLETVFPDSSDLLAIVRTLLAEAELEELRRTLAELHAQLTGDEAARTTRGGLNVALKARLQAPRLRATARQLRRSYQEFLAGGEPIDTYELWIDLYGFERRSQVVDFIEQALAADMYALDPSCSRLEFGRLLQAVRQLTTLRSADHLLQQHCWNGALMTRLGVDQRQLLGALLRMVRQGGGLADLFQGLLAGVAYAMAVDEKAGLVQGMRRFLKALPHGLWADIGLQVQALEEVDALLDVALARERLLGGARHRVEA
ncbi:type III secretion system gatekeeper subunit SctW [Stenotrophomonas sp. NPDC077659]|uniref:type III secretion system gatekeeper subunit SctW n=1 Tax=Stenotrophomonas sp. NPDC077659 TaxID=3390694 RepID=UPI003D094005